MPSIIEVKNSINTELIANAQADPMFRKALLENPRAAIEKKFRVSLPPEIEFKVVEESATINYVVLPAVSGGELSDADLATVTGGWFTCLRACAESKGETQKALARF